MATKTKMTYSSIRKEAEKPVAERSAVVFGRDGQKRTPRRYHASQKRVVELRKTAGKGVPNPFRGGGIYHGLVQALINLGPDKGHDFPSVKAEIKKVMSGIERGETTAWKVFADRAPKKDAANPKDLNGRIMQTATVLQRLSGAHPYGLKLAQLLMCIDILAGKDNQPLYKLHTKGFVKTDKVRPTNDLKGRRKAKAAVKPKAKAKAKKVAKK